MTKILLAEDDDSMRTFLAAALRRAGHEVQDYADGETALSALEREVFDLLLTDIVMPGLDGIELAIEAYGAERIEVMTNQRVRELLFSAGETVK